MGEDIRVFVRRRPRHMIRPNEEIMPRMKPGKKPATTALAG